MDFMDRIAEFRRNANECRAMAARTDNEATKLRLEDLAMHWTDLARYQDEFLTSFAPLRLDSGNDASGQE